MNYEFQPIGFIRSCFKEKFGIPRQPGLVSAARANLELLPPWDRDEAVRGLEGFSHIWVLFIFHASLNTPWRPTVRPPRLGGNRRIGVFASRSPFRPNPIGLSALQLDGIERRDGRLTLDLSGVDLLDGTPVLDIKPYIPYADSITTAVGGFADTVPGGTILVRFSDAVRSWLNGLPDSERQQLEKLIVQILEQDPRPAYLDADTSAREFGMRLLDYNVRWSVDRGTATVIGVDIIPGN